MGWGWHGWYMGWMWIFWIAVIFVIVWLIVRPGGTANPPPPRETPEEILKRRYASGEISQDEYQRMLSEIRH